MYHHHFDIRQFEEMIPWEKEIYISLLAEKVEDENMRLELQKSAQRASGGKRK